MDRHTSKHSLETIDALFVPSKRNNLTIRKAKKPLTIAEAKAKGKTGWSITGNKRIRRNAPCPCGSGKKYKHCCMVKIVTCSRGLVR